MPFRKLLTPIMQAQDVFSMALMGFVQARGGRVTFAGNEVPDDHPRLWNSQIMHKPRSVSAPKSMTESPLFSLEHIGGLAGSG